MKIWNKRQLSGLPTFPAATILPVVMLIVALQSTAGQDVKYALSVINRLSSFQMHGRGYLKNADLHVAGFIRHQWEAAGVKPLGNDFCQFFRVNVNTFPGRMKIEMNDHVLVPGHDFLINPSSPGLKGRFIPVPFSPHKIPGAEEEAFLKAAAGKILLVDFQNITSEKSGDKSRWNDWIRRICFSNPYGLAALIEISEDKLNFGASSGLLAIPHIMVSKLSCPENISGIRTDIKNRFMTGYQTQNMIGYIPGQVCPDSFIVFTAHYDHLGMMGRKTFFPGANDNASGVAMMLGLSRYFSMHPQRFSVAFISFSAEELGLLGSAYFTENPLIPLGNLKFLVNLDIVGTGIDGITVVNATEFPLQFESLASINRTKGYVKDIRKRGKACNSDHCPFYGKDVPCFFIYTLGGISAYHDVNDRAETLPLTAFEGLTRLLIDFTGTF